MIRSYRQLAARGDDDGRVLQQARLRCANRSELLDPPAAREPVLAGVQRTQHAEGCTRDSRPTVLSI